MERILLRQAEKRQELFVVRRSVKVREVEPILEDVFARKPGLRLRLLQQHEPTVDAFNGAVLVANTSRNFRKGDVILALNLGDIGRFAEGIPLLRTVDVTKAEILPQRLAGGVNRNRQSLQMFFLYCRQFRQIRCLDPTRIVAGEG